MGDAEGAGHQPPQAGAHVDLKAGVKWGEGIHASIWYARAVIGQVHFEMFGYVATCTDAERPVKPGVSSLHPEGKALDVRINHLTSKQTYELADMLRVRLGPDFDVVIEGPLALKPALKNKPPHIHVEWDPGDVAA